MRTMRVYSKVTEHKAPPGFEKHLDEGLRHGLSHVAAAWSSKVWYITEALHSQGFHIDLVDEIPEAEGALGYHDVDEHGRPFIRVAVGPVLSHGGAWLDGPLSVASVVDHEAKEVCVDPAANRWCNDANGVNWAMEAADPVQSDVYPVFCVDGTRVTLSNFVFPDYFNAFAEPGTRLDYMGVLTSPFSIAPGGYAIKQTPGRITEVFAHDLPAWRANQTHRAKERSAWFPGYDVNFEIDASRPGTMSDQIGSS